MIFQLQFQFQLLIFLIFIIFSASEATALRRYTNLIIIDYYY